MPGPGGSGSDRCGRQGQRPPARARFPPTPAVASPAEGSIAPSQKCQASEMTVKHRATNLRLRNIEGCAINQRRKRMLLRAHPVRRRRAGLGVSLIALLSLGLSSSGHGADADTAADHAKTATPIKHVVVIIGENRSFDHIFATYVPKSGQSIKNLLSEGIVNADGSPGPNFHLARPFKQNPVHGQFKDKFFISLANGEKTPYQTLPVPGLNFAPNVQQVPTAANFIADGVIPPFTGTTSTSLLAALDPSLEHENLGLLTTGAAIGLSEN